MRGTTPSLSSAGDPGTEREGRPRASGVGYEFVPAGGPVNADRPVAPSPASPGFVPDPYSPLYTRYVLFMVLLTMIFSNVDRTILSILVEPIKQDFQLTDTQMGWLLGPAFAVVYTILCLPLGRYADTTGVRRNIVAYSLFVWSLFAVAVGRQ